MSGNPFQLYPPAIISMYTHPAFSRDVNEEAEIGKRQRAQTPPATCDLLSTQVSAKYFVRTVGSTDNHLFLSSPLPPSLPLAPLG